VTRRNFLGTISLAAAGSFFLPRMVMAGPFVPGDFQKFVPADKKLSDEWVRSLFERGTPRIYSGADLKYIGMPVGGICAGQLYLGGDGQLWHWDIFNNPIETGSTHYKEPPTPTGSVEQGFALRILSGSKEETRPLDAKGFPGVTFCGQYPVGTVTYSDPAFPLETRLEAFSPFIPLDLDDSSLPATVMKFTVKNTSTSSVEAELGGWLQNVISYKSGQLFPVVRTNRTTRTDGAIMLECGFRETASTAGHQDRPVIVFDDFEREEWGSWKVEGTAFGKGPAEGPQHDQKLAGYQGKRTANSFTEGESRTGKLTSVPFTIERRFINFLIGGGNHMRPDGQVEAGINLMVDGKVVRNATGSNTDAMSLASWEVSELEGKTALLEIVDGVVGPWGHIAVDQIEFSDRSPLVRGTGSEQPDAGSLSLALLDSGPEDRVNPLLQGDLAGACFAPASASGEAERPAGTDKAQKLVGSVVRSFKLAPGATKEITFVLAWDFPNLVFPFTFRAGQAPGEKTAIEKGRYYGTKFDSAKSVVGYVAKNARKLIGDTELWHDSWYDSTLPYWFLDRTMLNASILATSTCLRFADGRFYGWEGVGCCSGTCTHVWHYEQAMGRLFPELDILLRDKVDFNPQVGFNEKTGVIGHRGDANRAPAADGQAGTILRAYRDYLVSPDTEFLKRNWPQIKHATEWMMALDSDHDGILDLPQSNTLDGTWYGKIPWITSLGLAAVQASEQMALVMGDTSFAETCKQFVAAGKANFEKTFWNGEYFEQIHDPSKLEHVGSYNGCEIDQVFGQGWAFQVGLDRVLPEEKTKEALNAIWKYNFTPDVGPYRKERPAGRWYAMPGEGGTLMCSWPHGDQLRVTKGFDYYFNECMNGFEHQVAGHMIWEGAPGSDLVKHGLAIERAVNDRYDGSKRNPWNEVECGDHYARSMASYGVFLAACGFSYNGPEGRIGFAPKLTPENFKAAFTAAEGWGSFSQKQTGKEMTAKLALKYGNLRLTQVALAPQQGLTPKEAQVTLDGKSQQATLKSANGQVQVVFNQPLLMAANQTLVVVLK
jgi:uncharacterized protein (DUF608 family)